MGVYGNMWYLSSIVRSYNYYEWLYSQVPPAAGLIRRAKEVYVKKKSTQHLAHGGGHGHDPAGVAEIVLRDRVRQQA